MANFVLTSPTASASPGAANWALNSVRSSGRVAINAAATLTINDVEVGASNAIVATYEGVTAGVGVAITARVAGANFTVSTVNPVTGFINYAILG